MEEIGGGKGKGKGKSARKSGGGRGGGMEMASMSRRLPEGGGNPSWLRRTPKAAYFEGRMKKHCPLSEKGWIEEIGGEEAASSRALGPFYYS